jgi:DNA-binding transcriptional MerR regulator
MDFSPTQRQSAEVPQGSNWSHSVAPVSRLKPDAASDRVEVMEPRYTIGWLAREAGVPASTVRYYERSRLLRPDGRTDGNYRIYGPEALERLRFIRAAQAIGLTLDDITTLLDFRDGRTAPCREVQTLIEERLSELKQRLEQLHHVQTVLHSSLRMCRKTERRGRCEVIEKLKVAASGPTARALAAHPPGNPQIVLDLELEFKA